MRVHRLTGTRHGASALDGEGARRFGGRWNPAGMPMVYCASSLALAVLELLVHVDPRDVPSDLVAIEIEIPEDLKARTLNPPDLPSDWKLESGKAALQALGATWILSGTEAILRVPSVIVPSEPNLLINPGSAGPRRFKLPVSVGELILSGNRVSARTEEIAIAT